MHQWYTARSFQRFINLLYIYIRAAGHVWHRPSRRWPKVSPTSLVWQLLVTLLVNFSLLRMAFHLLFTLDLRNSSSCFFFPNRYDRSSGASQRSRWTSLWRDFSWSWRSRPISSLVPNRLFHSNLQVKPIVFHFFSSVNDSKNVTKDRFILFCISLYDYIK